MMSQQMKADIMLMIITVFWGGSYILTKIALEGLAPFNLTALRFLMAFVVAAVVFYPAVASADRRTIGYGGILAAILFGVFVTMTFGLQATTASNAGFLISLSVVFVPLLSAAWLRQKIERKVVAGVCMATVGIGLLTLHGELSMGYGDLLCLACAFLFGIHIIVTGVLTREVNSISLGVWQLGFVGLFSLIFSLYTEGFHLPATEESWFAVLSLSIPCTAVGYIVQTAAQQHTSPTRTGLILSLEPVFSAVFAYVFLAEVLNTQGYVGAVILLASVLLVEWPGERERQCNTDSLEKGGAWS